MRKFLIPILSFFVCTGVFSQDAPRSYIAYFTETPLNIDGKGLEKVWDLAPESEAFIDIEGEKQPKYRTIVKMLYDDDYLYFYSKMLEPHVWATLKQRDTVIFYNNDFEIFIDPDGDTHNYFEFEMNALNTVWDLFIPKPYREPGPILDSWDIQGLKSAVHVEGTLNNPSDIDEYWSVEVAIPWAVLREGAPEERIPIGDFWRINFSRVNWDHDIHNGTYSRKRKADGTYFPEYNWVWSPQGVINMHEPEHWGYVYFSEKTVGGSDEFQIPQDEKLRWLLYDIYRAQKNYFTTHGQWATSVEKLGFGNLEIEGQSISTDLEVHGFGWNLLVKSPFSENTYLMKEDGDLQLLNLENASN